jgi:hypothetical protein
MTQVACAPSLFEGLSGGKATDAAASDDEVEPGGDDAAQAGDAAGGDAESDVDAALHDADAGDATSPGAGERDASGAGSGSDGGGRDAGGQDGPLSDSGRPADSAIDSAPPGDSRCYDRFATRLMCEGFEIAQLPAPWNRAEEGGAVTRAATPRPHLGLGALAARVTSSGSHAFALRPVFPSLTSGRIFLRSYVYVASGVALNGFIIHGMSEENEPYGGVSVLVEDSGYQLDVHPRGPGVSPIFIRSEPPVQVVRDRWVCLQLELTIHATMGAVTLRVDGAIAAQSTQPLATLPASGYRGVSGGIVYTDPMQATPLQVYVDEFVADTANIPCDVASAAPGPEG